MDEFPVHPPSGGSPVCVRREVWGGGGGGEAVGGVRGARVSALMLPFLLLIKSTSSPITQKLGCVQLLAKTICLGAV